MAEQRPGDGLWRRSAVVVALLSGLLAVSACSTVPSAGPPVAERGHGNSGAEALDRPYVQRLPPKPAPSDDAAQTVAGFREAMSDFADNHAAARRFLTPQEAKVWDADATTVIYEEAPAAAAPVTSRDVSGAVSVTYTYTVKPVAALDRDHGYRLWGGRAPGGSAAPAGVGSGPVEWKAIAVADGGQWRLSYASPGILLPHDLFEDIFQAVQVYFPASVGRELVPDRVYLPSSPDDLVEPVVDQLVSGPTSWLRGAVRRVLPEGSSVRGVQVTDNGIADVDFGGAARTLDNAGREDLIASVTWSLAGQLPFVQLVSVSIDGVSITPKPTNQSTLSGFGSQDAAPGSPLYVQEGKIQRLDSADVRLQPPLAFVGATEVAEPVSGGLIAAIRRVHGVGDGLWLTAGTTWRHNPVFASAQVSSPTWMADGSQVWVLATDATGEQSIEALTVLMDSGPRVSRSRVAVDFSGLPTLRGGAFTAIRLSRDGVRLALIYDGLPYVGVVTPGRDGQPPTVSNLRLISPPCAPTSGLCPARGLSWVDGNELAVLTGGEQTSLLLVTCDGFEVRQESTANWPSNANTVTAAPGVADDSAPRIVVSAPITDSGPWHGQSQLYQLVNNTWKVSGVRGSHVRFPD